ncbi:MAG: triose-phosphate isomerase [Candidatus Cloacimonetes bacterium]|nr:triose-phosphate isomerase [Candidatus Cloacimonadota bacterium]
MRKIYLAGNWKMNKTFQEADDFLYELGEYLEEKTLRNVEAIICPPFPYLELVTDMAEELPLSCGAQNVSEYKSGAYTGEISAEMLSSMEVEYCITGHSERRNIFGESNSVVNAKIKQLQEHFIIPILCIGEKLEERDAGKTDEVVLSQLQGSLKDIKIDGNLFIAYEPVWAIGTGKTATPQQAQEVHKLIREWLRENYGEDVAADIPILYGGSVKPGNLKELLREADIDGGLIGGASLEIEGYIKMLEIAGNLK